MSRESVKVTVHLLHVYPKMNGSLSSIHEHLRTFTMRKSHYLVYRIYYAQHIRYLSHAHEFRVSIYQFAQSFDIVVATRRDRKNSYFCSSTLTQQLPRNYIRMVFRLAHYYIITLPDELFSESTSHQIYGKCGARCEDNLFSASCIQILPYEITSVFISFRSLCSQFINRPMDIGIMINGNIGKHIHSSHTSL